MQGLEFFALLGDPTLFFVLNFERVAFVEPGPDSEQRLNRLKFLLLQKKRVLEDPAKHLSELLMLFELFHSGFRHEHPSHLGSASEIYERCFARRCAAPEAEVGRRRLAKLRLGPRELDLLLGFLEPGDEGAPQAKALALQMHSPRHYDPETRRLVLGANKANLLARAFGAVAVNLDQEHFDALTSLDRSLEESFFLVARYFLQELLRTLAFVQGGENTIDHPRAFGADPAQP